MSAELRLVKTTTGWSVRFFHTGNPVDDGIKRASKIPDPTENVSREEAEAVMGRLMEWIKTQDPKRRKRR